jgi:SAM-dependent methyltransferase
MSRFARLEQALLLRLPPRLGRLWWRLRHLPADLVAPRSDPLVPPRGLAFVGAGDFVAVGDALLAEFVGAGLRPRHRVLDAGCGLGRMARPLAGFLDGSRYAGFDVVAADVEWCRRRYAARHPHFRFEHLDVANAAYNPGGRMAADRLELPFPDGDFDFAIAISLFTHLLPAAARRYLGEVARTLAPGGRLYATFFVLDEAARAAIAAGRTELRFEHELAGARVQSLRRPEAAIAFERDELGRWLAAAGLELERFTPGTWLGTGAASIYQDVVVARRPGAIATGAPASAGGAGVGALG